MSTMESDGLGLQAKQTPWFRGVPVHAAHLGSNITELSSPFRYENHCDHQTRSLLVCS